MNPAANAVHRLRPTTILPFLAWGLLLAAQLITPADTWSAMLVGLGVLLAVSYGWARLLRDRVRAERRVSGTWVIAGDQLREAFSITNDGWLPVLWARVRDGSAVPGYCADRVESADARSERRWTTVGTCERRGVFRLGPWDLIMGDPFGLFEVTHHYPDVTTIMVYPRAAHLPDLELPRGRATSRAAASEASALETITVGGLRDYVPGDPLRRIHWAATAHRGRPMVREFDREPSGDLWLVVDMDEAAQAGHGSEATTEYTVVLAASMAARYLREGERRAVGLLVSGRNPALLPPTRGQTQLWRILRTLAEAEPAPGCPLSRVLDDLAPNLGIGRTLVVITPSQEPAWVASLLTLHRRDNAPAVLLLDSTTFTPPTGTPDQLIGLRALLAAQRIPHWLIAQGLPFHPMERIRRRRRELRSLSGTGRVISVEVEEEV